MKHARAAAPLLAILILAAFLRLNGLDLIDLRYDEAAAPVFASSIARGQLLFVAPFSGSVANHPPLFLYALALPYLFTRDILAVAAYRVALDLAAIALCWVLCARYFSPATGRRVANIAALLYAVSPWAIQFARKLWVAPLPLFTLVFLFGLLEVVQRRSSRGWAVMGWGWALAIGAHLTGLLFAPVIFGVALARRNTLRWRPALLGLAPLVLLFALYVAGDARIGFANARALFGGSTTNALGSNPLLAFNFAQWSTGGAHLSDLTGPSFEQWRGQLPDLANVIDSLQIAFFVASVMVAVTAPWVKRSPRAMLRAEDADAAGALGFAWLAPAALLLLTRQPQMHYFTLLFPLPFVLMALLLDAFLGAPARTRADGSRAPAASFVAGVGALAFLSTWHVATTLAFTNFAASYPTAIAPARFPLQAIERARQSLPATGDVIIVVPGGDPSVHQQAAVMEALLGDTPHRFANSDAGLILRDGPAQYIVSSDSGDALNELRRNTRSTEERYGNDGAGGTWTYVFADAAKPQGFAPTPAATWEHGVQLLGVRDAHADGAREWQTLLRVTKPPPADGVHWFNYWLVNGARATQQDGSGIGARQWRVGDLLLHRFKLPNLAALPPKPWMIQVGSYRYPSGEGIGVLVNGEWREGVTMAVP